MRGTSASLKIEKTSLFAIKRKGRLFALCLARGTCVNACDTRDSTRAYLLPGYHSRRGGDDIGEKHTPSFLSPRWFNEPIRRRVSFPQVSRDFLPLSRLGASLGPSLLSFHFPSLVVGCTLLSRVLDISPTRARSLHSGDLIS